MRDIEDAQHTEDEGDAGRDEKQPRRERNAVNQDDRQYIHENRTSAAPSRLVEHRSASHVRLP